MSEKVVSKRLELLTEEEKAKKTEMIMEYLSMEEENKHLTETFFQEVKNSVLDLWMETGFQVSDMSTFIQATEFILNAERSIVETMLEQVNIKLTPKDRKKGRDAYYKRLILKYHQPHVRDSFASMFEFFAKEEIISIQEDSSIENIRKLVDAIGFEHVYWLAQYALENEEVMGMLENEYPKEYVKMLCTFYLLYVKTEFELIMHRPEELRSNQSNKNTQEAMQENKKLKRNFNKAKKQEKSLKQELHQLQKERKELKGEIHSLYHDSLQEIEQLKEENKLLLSSIEQERQMYLQIIQQLAEQNESDSTYNDTKVFDLQGKNIAVIGGNKERHYAEIIEKHNGQILFVPEDDYNKIRGAVSDSVGVFFLVELVGHHHFRETLRAAKEFNVPFVFVNSKGVSTFERELKRFVQQYNNGH